MFDLVKALNSYKPFDDLEKKSIREILNFLHENKNCFSRENLQGHITAGALVCDCAGNILLNHHKKSGKWFQFGGHSEGEEDCLNVARREIMEEAGITKFEMGVESIFDVAIINIPFNQKRNEPEHKHYDINFLFILKNKEFKISNESTEIKWVSIDEAKKIISPNDISMHRMIKKYQNWLKNIKK